MEAKKTEKDFGMVRATRKRIALNVRRAKFVVAHWNDKRAMKGKSGHGMTFAEAVDFEIKCIREEIDRAIEKVSIERPELHWKFVELRETVATKTFWDDLAANMKGTEVVACGLRFPRFEYVSYQKSFWKLEVGAKRRWLKKNALKLFGVAFLVWYAIHLWSPPAGDAPKPEPVKLKSAVAEKKTPAAKPNAGALAVGTRVVAKKEIPIYRFNEEKKPVVAGRVPPGTVLEVTGAGNAKVVQVSVELPNGKRGKGMVRVADLEE